MCWDVYLLLKTLSLKFKWSYSASSHIKESENVYIWDSCIFKFFIIDHPQKESTALEAQLFLLLYVNLSEGQTPSLTSASASVSKALWSPKLAWCVGMGEDRWARLSTKVFLSGWVMQPALPKVVRRRFSGLSAGPLLTATLCGLPGLGRTLGGWSGARLGLWLSALFLWRGTAAPSDRTLTLEKKCSFKQFFEFLNEDKTEPVIKLAFLRLRAFV